MLPPIQCVKKVEITAPWKKELVSRATLHYPLCTSISIFEIVHHFWRGTITSRLENRRTAEGDASLADIFLHTDRMSQSHESCSVHNDDHTRFIMFIYAAVQINSDACSFNRASPKKVPVIVMSCGGVVGVVTTEQ